MAYMPGRFAHFIARFMTDDQFRFSVLYQEETALDDPIWELEVRHKDAVKYLDAAEIERLLRADLATMGQQITAWVAQWGKALQDLQWEVHYRPAPDCASPAPPPPANGPRQSLTAAAAAAYTQDKTFFLHPGPNTTIAPGQPLTVKGVNFGPRAWICFALCPGEDPAHMKVVEATQVAVDADLYQHVTVLVPTQPGTWMMYGGYGPYPTQKEFVATTAKRGRVIVR